MTIVSSSAVNPISERDWHSIDVLHFSSKWSPPLFFKKVSNNIKVNCTSMPNLQIVKERGHKVTF